MPAQIESYRKAVQTNSVDGRGVQPTSDVIPSRGRNILTGPKARLAEGMLFAAAILEACSNGGGAVPATATPDINSFTPGPTSTLPIESATPSPTASQSPEASPTIDPTPTPSSSPSEAPVNAYAAITKNRPAVSLKTLDNAINALDATELTQVADIKQQVKTAGTGHNLAFREVAIERGIREADYAFSIAQDPKYLTIAEDLFNWGTSSAELGAPQPAGYGSPKIAKGAITYGIQDLKQK